MKQLSNIMSGLLGLLALGALAVALVFAFGGLPRGTVTSSEVFQSPIKPTGARSQVLLSPLGPPPQSPTPQPPTFPAVTSIPVPTVTPVMTPTPLPPIVWNPLPACENRLQGLTAWRQYVASRNSDPVVGRQLDAYLRQVRPMSAALRDVGLETLPSLLDVADTAPKTEVIRRELAVLWLNVMSGRLNRATEINFPALSGVHTVGDLLTELESALAEGNESSALLGASKQLLAGQGASRSVCAQLLHLQIGNTIQEITWSGAGLGKRSKLSQLNSADFPWSMGRLMPSPDYRWAAIETAGYERAGPVYLWSLDTGKLAKLNPVSVLGDGKTLAYDGLPTWQVIGWHPDSQHLMIGPSDAGGVYWINLASNTFQVIPFAGDGGVGGRDFVDLSSDGSKFIYIGRNLTNGTQQLNLYDLSSGKTTNLLTFPFSKGSLHFPRFSPTSDSVAYLIEKIYPDRGHVIQLLDFKTLAQTTLFEGELGLSEFNWSPDGRMIAFYRKDPSKSYIDIPSVGQLWHGNIWVVSVPSGEMRQITFIKGTAFRPTWSPDGRTLSFLTHDGSIGLTSLEQPGILWKAATTSADMPLFTSMFFVP